MWKSVESEKDKVSGFNSSFKTIKTINSTIKNINVCTNRISKRLLNGWRFT